MTGHLGHERNGAAGNEAGNVRNGTRPKTVLTESTGQVQVDVPRDRQSTFGPQIVRKRQRRLSGVDEIVLSLYARGLTTGERSAVDPPAGLHQRVTVAPHAIPCQTGASRLRGAGAVTEDVVLSSSQSGA